MRELKLNKKEIEFITYYLKHDLESSVFDNENTDILNWLECCCKHEIEYLNNNLIDKEDIFLNKNELEKLSRKLVIK